MAEQELDVKDILFLTAYPWLLILLPILLLIVAVACSASIFIGEKIKLCRREWSGGGKRLEQSIKLQ